MGLQPGLRHLNSELRHDGLPVSLGQITQGGQQDKELDGVLGGQPADGIANQRRAGVTLSDISSDGASQLRRPAIEDEELDQATGRVPLVDVDVRSEGM